MAGTKRAVEGLVGLVAETVLSSASDEKRSLEGIDVSGMQDGATCYVREFFATYRYFASSSDAPVFPFIVAPAVGQGRWRVVAMDLTESVDTDYVYAGIDQAGDQDLGQTGQWVDLNRLPWNTNQQGFQVTANGFWEYANAVRKQFLLSAKVSLLYDNALDLSIGIGVGTFDPHPQTYKFPPLVKTYAQIETERVEILQSISSGGSPASVQLRSNSAGFERIQILSAQMVITPA